MKLSLKKVNMSSDCGCVRASQAAWNKFTVHVLQVPTFGQALCSLSISKTNKPVNVVFENCYSLIVHLKTEHCARYERMNQKSTEMMSNLRASWSNCAQTGAVGVFGTRFFGYSVIFDSKSGIFLIEEHISYKPGQELTPAVHFFNSTTWATYHVNVCISSQALHFYMARQLGDLEIMSFSRISFTLDGIWAFDMHNSMKTRGSLYLNAIKYPRKPQK